MFGLQLLPGLRDIRSALVSGYLWLFAGWLLVVGQLSDPQHFTGTFGHIRDLIHWAGPVATAAGVTLLAYVVGAVLESLGRVYKPFQFLVFFMSPGNNKLAASRVARRYNFSWRGRVALELFVQRALDDAYEQLATHKAMTVGVAVPSIDNMRGVDSLSPKQIDHADLERFRYYTELAIARDLTIIAMRLVGESDELFAQIDRFRSEADFRQATTAPLLVISIALALNVSPIWLVGIPFLFLYYLSGVRRRKLYGDAIIDAMRIGKITAPVFERLRVQVQDAIDSSKPFNYDKLYSELLSYVLDRAPSEGW